MRMTRAFNAAALAALTGVVAVAPIARATPRDCQSLQGFSDDMIAWGKEAKALTAPGTRGGTDAEFAQSQARRAALVDRLRETSGRLEDPELGEQARELADGMGEAEKALREYQDFAGADGVLQDGLSEQREQDLAQRWQSVLDLTKRRVELPIASIRQQCPRFWPPQRN